jgi:hypothetical protein
MPRKIILLLFSYSIFSSCSSTGTNAKKGPLDTILKTGFYGINISSNSYKRQLAQSDSFYSIDPIPIALVKNFTTISQFYEKDCHAIIIWLDDLSSKK